MPAQPVPDGYHTVTPYLTVKGANALINFITRAFGAQEAHVMRGPNGEVQHGDMMVGDSHVMVGEAGPQWQPMPAQLYLHLPDCDAVYKQAIAAGGISIQEPTTQFYGDRHGAVKDPCGNTWWIATHVEDVPPAALATRAANAARERS